MEVGVIRILLDFECVSTCIDNIFVIYFHLGACFPLLCELGFTYLDPNHGRGRGGMNEHRATKALIDAFETETQYSKPKRVARYHVSNLTTERKRLRESRASDLR